MNNSSTALEEAALMRLRAELYGAFWELIGEIEFCRPPDHSQVKPETR